MKVSRKQIAIASVCVFLLAFGVRLLMWQDARVEAPKVQSSVAANYKNTAASIAEGGVSGFFTRPATTDLSHFGHPPGYPIVIAVLTSVFGNSNHVIQLFQITCDALGAVVIFLIAVDLFPFAVGLIAGLLAALSPQFAWNSVLLLPDTLAMLPILLAVYFLTRAFKRPRVVHLIAAGVMVGLSTWLRANALLLAPFLAIVVLILFPKAQRLRLAGVLMLAAMVTIAPITIHNWIVTGYFIPVSLGAGQTMLEGIADYDPQKRFGIPQTDMGIMKMEADQYQRPEYLFSLFEPDGVKRERLRLRRAFGVVRDHPFWFAGVMTRRAASMLRLERTRLISPTPTVSHSLNVQNVNPAWTGNPAYLIGSAANKPEPAESRLSEDSQTFSLSSGASIDGVSFKSVELPISPYRDYLLRIPVVVEQGRMAITVAGVGSGAKYVSAVVDFAEVLPGQSQPRQSVELAFVSSDEKVVLEFGNATKSSSSMIKVGSVEMFDLGNASFRWTRYPRMVIRSIQYLLITAVILPLALIGTALLIKRRSWTTLILIWCVPAYYFLFQSMLHTEYRYVLAIYHFLFVLAGYSLCQLGSKIDPRKYTKRSFANR